jgi:hypothetical protein
VSQVSHQTAIAADVLRSQVERRAHLPLSRTDSQLYKQYDNDEYYIYIDNLDKIFTQLQIEPPLWACKRLSCSGSSRNIL